MRVTRYEDPSSANAADGTRSPLLSLEKIDDGIRKDIAEVLRHEKISEEQIGELEYFWKQLDELRKRLRSVQGFDQDNGLEMIAEMIKGCDGHGSFWDNEEAQTKQSPRESSLTFVEPCWVGT